MTTKREAELELEVLRLRSALEIIAGIRPCVDVLLGNADIAKLVLSVNVSAKALTALVEKVEKLTIERCASAYAEETRTWKAWPQAGAAMRQGSKAIRALPTGNIKLEDLL